MAQELKHRLGKLMPEQTVTLVPTKYAGHAEKLAYKLALATKRPLIMSASGDGGYHEVINGLMRAQIEGARPIAGLLPAGNANDHFHSLHDMDTAHAIRAGRLQTIDLLHLSGTVKGKTVERYAHSYIGIGLTPKVGQELNKTSLNKFNEVWIVLKALRVLQPVRIIVNGSSRAYDSLIFSNVGTMSKVLSLSDQADMADGKFEVTAFPRRSKLKLIATLLRASTSGLPDAVQTKEFNFRTVKKLVVQLDGEISTLDPDTNTKITIAMQVLQSIV
jgi:diacylglycerol kinase (ATP)